jgi:hypothetical protein
VVVAAVPLLVALLWGRREAALAAILWVAAGTGALDTARGAGFLPGLWARPGPSLLWLATLAVILVAGRWRGGLAAGVAAAAAWIALGRRWPDVGLADALLALTLDQHVWLVAGLAGLRRVRDRAALALVAGGALLTLSRGLGGPGDAWAGGAFVRTGLVLGAALWLEAAAPALASVLSEPARRALERRRIAPERVPTAIVLTVLLAGSLLVWWDPPRMDAVAKASLDPVPDALVDTMAWMRAHTPPDAVVLADEDYQTAVAVLGGRRLLRAPALVTPTDDERRLRLERGVFAGDPPAALRQRYSLRYVLVAPGQFRQYGLEAPEDLQRTGTLRLAYANPKGLHLYEIVPPGGQPQSFK